MLAFNGYIHFEIFFNFVLVKFFFHKMAAEAENFANLQICVNPVFWVPVSWGKVLEVLRPLPNC